MPDIMHYLTINAPAERVYQALTTKEGISGWWTDDTVIEPSVESVAQFNFADRYRNKMKIIRLDPPKQVVWRCIEGDKEWVDTTFSFDLEETQDATILRFGHNDWRAATDFFASCNYQWAHYMTSLKKYCETGKGEPFQDRA
jgi:uncharacterized protein YndB with AHSA1/START domain